ncbi:Na/Pi-cotransporter II-related protein [Denitrovibrio acetiphilus DSM 12809]|uniref:Na/Pi-cotransporter II-related protein n=1 Tax=Denitrovibrio acetiphilus (strain DSM 12809 / NBRC 114555 / N2460) TaxID=522772 RepID=D4H7K0_DENA2|nr:Na/Pi cotransporter family protein [Denitrovibrio acetiphilus]ADD67999.1 Na/Pi-cotransporter II-related protein [Denitrovibrio acetiphilus DSM 12809]
MHELNWGAILFGFIGGLGLFLYGMKLMSEGLQKTAGSSLKNIIEKFTSNRFIGVLVGTLVTVIVQSSSATTVMVVSFVNAGLMNLFQALSVVLGANIGTTITAQLIAFKITKFALPAIGLGVGLALFSKDARKRYYGEIILGFGLLFFGLSVMKQAFIPLKEAKEFADLFVYLSVNPVAAAAAGAILTVIVQSSSATIGITIAMASTGLLDFHAAAALVLGENIGTTITANLAALGGSRTAKQAAFGHFLLNFFGVAYMLIFLSFLIKFIDFYTPGAVDFVAADGTKPYIARHVANLHTAFNIINMVIFLPFIHILARICERVIKSEPKKKKGQLLRLDDNMAKTPSIAIAQAKIEVEEMSKLPIEMLKLTQEALVTNCSKLKEVKKIEAKLDELNHEFSAFLTLLTQQNISERTSHIINDLTHVIHNLEKIGDHVENIARFKDKMLKKDISFSHDAEQEVLNLMDVVLRFTEQTIHFYNNPGSITTLDTSDEDLIDNMRKKFKNNHMKRLSKGNCEINSGIVFVDIINNLEKIGDHVYNIAQVMMYSKDETLHKA